MTDQQLEIGEIIEFSGYGELADGQSAILKEGQKLKIEDIGKDDKGVVAYRVRPVLEDGTIDYEAGGETIFKEEFKTIDKQELLSNGADESFEEEPDHEEFKFQHDPVVLDLIKGTNDIVGLAKKLHVEREDLYYRLGGIIVDIKEKSLHVEAGYEKNSEGFAAFIDNSIGISQRTAYYMVSTYKRLRKAGLTSKDLEGIGWTKARLLAQVKDDEELEEWISKAKTLTRKELEEQVTEGQKVVNTEKIQKVTYNFTLYGDQNMLVEQALDHAKQQVDGKNEKEALNKAFEHICTQYVILETDTNVEEKHDN